jgi:hypothetical protein
LPISQIGELQVMVADHQRQLVELTGAIDRIDDPDILAQLAGAAPIGLASALRLSACSRGRCDLPRCVGANEPRGVSQIDPGCVKTQALNLRVENPS